MIVAQRPDRFVIHWDELRGSASFELCGFWSLDDMNDFSAPAAEVIKRSRARHGHALVLFDLRNSEIASASMIENFQSGGTDFVQWSDRIALVFSSALLKMQVRRINDENPSQPYFATMEEADAWLHAPMDGKAAASA